MSDEKTQVSIIDVPKLIKPPEIRDELTQLVEPIWERQPGEAEIDYAKFLYYAAMSPKTRTIRKAYSGWSGGGPERESGTYAQISRANKWIERAAAWDIAKLKEIQMEWVHKDDARRNADYELADVLRQMAALKFRDMLEKIGEGKTEELTPHMATRFAELASTLQRGAIPETKLDGDEMRQIMNALPEERRKNIIAIVMSGKK